MSLKELLKSGQTIIAIDDPDKIKNVHQLANAERVAAIKVGLPIILACDLKIIKTLKKISKKYLILDLKISDIPLISGPIVSQAIKLGCDALIVQGFVGKQVIRECVQKCADSGVMVFVVTGMTHEDSECHLTNLHAREIAMWAKKEGAHGIIVPGNNSENPGDAIYKEHLEQIRNLKQIVGDELLVIAVGVGDDGQGGDQNTCIRSGADCVIIGRGREHSYQTDSLIQKIYAAKFYLTAGTGLMLMGCLVIPLTYPIYLGGWVMAVILGEAFLLMQKYDGL